MRASEMAEDFPVVGLDSDALDAARLLATNRLSGLVMIDRDGRPHSILPASEVVQSEDTILEVAAVMARMRCPRVAVMDGDTLVGVVTASRLLESALRPR